MVAVSYYPALSAGFVWDDAIIFGESAVRSWTDLWTVWFSPSDIEGEGHYWPILYTTFWLEHQLWGLDPFGYHLVNVLLYMANVLLLWRLLLCLAVPGTWAVAAVFAVHPMHVESVAWVIGRKDLLSGLFYMAAALCWVRCMKGIGGSRLDSRDPPVPGKHLPSRSSSRRWLLDLIPAPQPALYLAALGLFLAAMLSKSVAVTLPVAFAVYLWWKNGRVTWTDASRIAPFLVVALGIAAAGLSYYGSRVAIALDYGYAERVLIAGRALWFYAGKLVWPTDLAVIYPLWQIDTADSVAWGYVIAAVAVAALLWIGRRRLGRGPLAGVGFFAVALSPMLGFLDFSYMQFSLVADRYAYLAGIGVIAVLVGAAARGLRGSPGLLRIGTSGVLVAVLGVFGKMTWEQAGIYADEVSFGTHIVSLNPAVKSVHRNLEAHVAGRAAVERRPGSADAHNELGSALYRLNRSENAEESFRRALELDPDHRNARQNIAEMRRIEGRFAESIEWYRAALDIDPEFAEAHAGMGVALFRLGRYEAAAESLAQAVSLGPDVLPISGFYLLAEALRRLRRHEEAIEAYRDVLEIDPEHASAHAGIGFASLRLKRHAEAIGWLGRSVSLQPESPVADRHVAMGRAYQELGRTPDAAKQYERALMIDSDNAKAVDALAVLRFQQRRYDDALRLFETLIAMGEGGAQVHANVGATLHYLGRPEEALRSLERARALDPALEMARTGVEKLRETPQRERE